ncbi:hypothetical protein AcW1_010228 [Taiwanofungus camphoratus]|nr:hypothetical protein AcW1_010228 [Antrodia cinnamomea]
MPTNSSSVNASSVSLTSSSLSPGLPAHDLITIYTAQDVIAAMSASDEIVCHPLPKTLTITLVIVACSVLNKEYPRYQLQTTQCYWFAGLVLHLVAGENVMQQLEDKNTCKAGEFAWVIRVMRQPDLTRQAQRLRPKFEAKLQGIEDGIIERK